ncbi:MAG: GNAT family N-acetyltransferase, partial [archaeon]
MGLEVQIKGITKDNIRQLLPSLLSLEPHWVAIGDKAWTADSFEKDLPAKWELSKYASVDGKVVGYFIASVDGEVGKLNKVLVNPDFRGQGIGDMLWEEFLDGCRKHSVERAEFKVLPGNPSAARLYRSKGCLFAGQALGSDGLLRDNIIYPFRLEERISHSRPVITSDDKEAVMRAIDNGDLVTGNFVNSLVDQFSRYIGRKYGIATSSGTAALHLALRALDVKQGDEVILPSYVCNAVLNAVKYCDATPVLVDINP